MSTYLEGVAIQFYRGIGPETQYIAPFSDMNFFVGANNSGKSIVLKLIAEMLSPNASGSHNDAADFHRGENEGTYKCSLGITVQSMKDLVAGQLTKRIDTFHGRVGESPPIKREDVDDVSAEIAHQLSRSGAVWLGIANNQSLSGSMLSEYSQEHYYGLDIDLWQRLGRLFGLAKQDNYSSAARTVLRELAKDYKIELPDRLLIPAKRELDAGDNTLDDLSGKGLISHLAKIQNPDYDERERKEQFDKINEFVRAVTGKPEALLEVPNHREHLLVHMDGKVLPLSSLGTGIHEVILIAAFCTIHEQKIMCIEEPEIHLHPILQRKLVQYLQENTNNQYFIATHSAALIDTHGASVFYVHNDGVQTFVEAAITKNEQRQICDELGYRASDLLQANAVIWVEGPSDRIYIRHWLSAYDNRLIEGVHYSIMFYGGGLISHLSAQDEALKEFIELQKLNRNLAVVIDSDKDCEAAELKPAARRLVEEINTGEGVVWVTEGREIENYLPYDQLQETLMVLHPNVYGGPLTSDPFAHAYHFKRKVPKDDELEVYRDADKVRAAAVICTDDQTANLDALDLRARVIELAEMIAKASGLEPISYEESTD